MRFSAQPGDVAIVNVSVVPMQREGILRDHVVVVRASRIVAVVPAGSVDLGATVKRIDGHGGFLLPGLADMHVHTFFPGDLTLFVAAGVTTVRNMFGAPMHLELRAKIAAGEVLGPTLVTAGPIIDGDPPVWPGSTVLTKAADAEEIVLSQQKAGYDFLKVYSRLSADAYQALVAAAKRHSMPFAGHVPIAVPLAEALASGQRSIEHLEGYLRALLKDGKTVPKETTLLRIMPFLAENTDEAKLAPLAVATAKSEVWNCPTVVVWNRMGRLDDPETLKKQTKWVEYVAPEMLAFWDPKSDFRLKGATAEDYARLRNVDSVRSRILAALYRAGGKLLVGTDTGNPYVVPGSAMHDEIELLVAAGVPRPAVLRAATSGAAEFLGKSGDFGVVAKGARADLILSPTNPLEGPIAIPPTGVMVRGVWHEQSELSTKLDALRH
jgi:imidazolonepropionase-like amidohydrolase